MIQKFQKFITEQTNGLVHTRKEVGYIIMIIILVTILVTSLIIHSLTV
jgi:hypothetical protein